MPLPDVVSGLLLSPRPPVRARAGAPKTLWSQEIAAFFLFAYQANFTAVIVSNACMAPPADLEPFSLFSHFRHTPCLVHRVPCCVVFPIYLRKQAQRIDLSVHQNRKSQTGIFRLIRFCRIFRILDLPRRPDHFPLRVFYVFRLFRIFLWGENVKYPDRRTVQRKQNESAKHSEQNCSVHYFFAILILGQGRLMGCLEYTLIALVIVIALSIALELFLSAYLLYHYDHDEPFDESEE